MKDKKKKTGKFDDFFEISKRKTSIKTEIFAGLTTFLAMAYILIVNPNNIHWGGTDISILFGKVPGISWKFWENIGTFFSSKGVFLSMFHDGFKFPAESLMTTIMLIISFSMIDMFDTMGTVVGCCSNANLLDKEGKPINYGKMMYADSIATITGSLYGQVLLPLS